MVVTGTGVWVITGAGVTVTIGADVAVITEAGAVLLPTQPVISTTKLIKVIWQNSLSASKHLEAKRYPAPGINLPGWLSLQALTIPFQGHLFRTSLAFIAILSGLIVYERAIGPSTAILCNVWESVEAV